MAQPRPRLLHKPKPLPIGQGGETIGITPAKAHWQYLSFKARKLLPGESWQWRTNGQEAALVVLGGTISVSSSAGHWPKIGQRRHVFDGLPYALYLPPGVSFTVTADSDAEFALASMPAQPGFPPKLVTPQEVRVEVRGGGNATRQINHLLPPDFPAQRLLVVEVYTPSGNWSSYPPHKHDRHNPPAEVDLEEIYYYHVDHPDGYAIQKVYTPDRRIDQTLTVRDGELVLIPEGYHPVVAAHGYNVYYLNALAGEVHSMAASDDPAYAWVRREWKDQDPRVPLVR